MRYLIYGKDNCVWCRRAIELLESNGLPYSYNNIKHTDGNMKAFKRDFPDAKTVPQILAYDDYTTKDIIIGGYDDLVKYLDKEIRNK